MTQTQLEHAVADRTGESPRTIHRLGFGLLPEAPHLESEDVRLVVNCPFCGRARPLSRPGRQGQPGPGRVLQPSLRRLFRLRHRRRLRRCVPEDEASPAGSFTTSRHSLEISSHDHAPPPSGPCPPRGPPPQRPRDRPPGAGRPDRLPRRGRPAPRPTSVRATWRSSTPPRSPGPRAARPPCRWMPWPRSRAATTRSWPSTPSPPTGPSSAGPTGASPSSTSTPSRRSTRSPRSPTCPRPGPRFPADLIAALAEATATSADDDTRYALGCLLLKAGREGHEVVATDGRQVLIRGGFAVPLGRRRPDPPLAALRLPGPAP